MTEGPESCEGQMPQPVAEHGKIQELVGTWNTVGKFYMGGPDAPPMESRGKEVVESVGGFWVTGHFTSDFMGQPFVGRSSMGFDPWKQEYISTWIDSMSAATFFMRGKRNGNVITSECDGVDPGTGNPTRYRTTEEEISPDERHFSMFMILPDGNAMKLFDMEYTRER